jgi:hypothetical protein
MSEDDRTAATIDALIDVMAELAHMEQTARSARQAIEPHCTRLFEKWKDKQ